jgi:hypothetical protein
MVLQIGLVIFLKQSIQIQDRLDIRVNQHRKLLKKKKRKRNGLFGMLLRPLFLVHSPLAVLLILLAQLGLMVLDLILNSY